MRLLSAPRRDAAPPAAPPVIPPAVIRDRESGAGARSEPLEAAPVTTRRRRRRSWWGESWRWGVTVLAFVVAAGLVIGGGLLAAVYRQARVDQARPVDAIVVLGTAQWNGRPGPTLRARLDHALALYRDGLAPVVVVTGGRAPGDRFTEAEAARAYLREQGVPAEAILMENAGRDTWESMRGVAALLAPTPGATMPPARVLLVSDGFHLLRVKLMARDLGLEPYASPAPGSPIRRGGPVEFSYAVREVGGIIEHLLRGA